MDCEKLCPTTQVHLQLASYSVDLKVNGKANDSICY
jgi:hypothetical protein